MKLHWSVADQELQFGVEHTGHKIMFPRITVRFFRPDYFMWGYEDKSTLLKRWKQLCGKQ